MQDPVLAEPAALLEREQEVDRIHEALRAAGRGEGSTLVVEGAAGVGKSRLLHEARTAGERLGLRVLAARATELEQGFPFGVVHQLFERLLLEADADAHERWVAGAAALAADVLTDVPMTAPRGPPTGDSAYALRHGLYWAASNIAADQPLALVIDDLQWCDAPSASALAFIARRLEAQPLALVLATRPLDPSLAPEAAALTADPATQVLRPVPLSKDATAGLIGKRLGQTPDRAFVQACLDVTGGNPFLLGELLAEAARLELAPTAGAADEVRALVPRGVANAVLLRLARLAPGAGALAGVLSVLGEGAQVGDAARLAHMATDELESAMAQLVHAGVVDAADTVRFEHPVIRAAIYDDLTRAERERLHQAAGVILAERGAPPGRVAAQVMHTEPAGDPAAVRLLRGAAHDALRLGDPSRAARLLSRALSEPPPDPDRRSVTFELGRALARAGSREAIAPLSEVAEHGGQPATVAAAAIELSNVLLFMGHAAAGAIVLRGALGRLPDGEPARAQLEIALLGMTCTSAAARKDADATVADLRALDPAATDALPATTLAAAALEEMMQPRSALRASRYAKRALAAGLPPGPHRSWELLAFAVLTVSDHFDDAQQGVDRILAEARESGAALTVAAALAHRAFIKQRLGALAEARAEGEAAIELASHLMGSEFVLVLAVPAVVLAGLDSGETPESLRRLMDGAGVDPDTELLAASQLRYASGLLRAAAGNHEAAIEELRSWAVEHPTLGSENPAALPWRSATALSLAELGNTDEARALAGEEVRRARSFGAPRAIGIALRAQAIVGPPEQRSSRLADAVAALRESPARLERARALLDLGAALRAEGQRRAAREPLLEALRLGSACGAASLEQRARVELRAIGVRPPTTRRNGADVLTPSERRVVELAAGGGTNRQIAQTLFVTEKTVETHLGHAFRKLDVSSRRQLPDVLAGSASG